MPRARTTLILSGISDANIRFADFLHLLRAMGFHERIRGDHHIFTRAGILTSAMCNLIVRWRQPTRCDK